MRKPIIAGNWKMNKTVEESMALSNGIKRSLFNMGDNIEIVLCPPFTSLSDVKDVITDTNILLGAQNMFWETEGAFTGEISASMLVSAGCKYVIIGHSERRLYFGETDETVNKKIGAAIENQLIPVFCIGETEAERDANQTLSVLDKQVAKGLNAYLPENLKTLIKQLPKRKL